MVNKRLLEMAERQKNRNLPREKTERTQQKKSENSNLVHILERDSKGKPKLTLNKLEETAVHTPTQEEYNTLMQVYECGGWRWESRDLPTQINYWDTYKEETCMRARNNFTYGDEKDHQERGYKIISTQEFCDIQNPPITPEMIDEINKWFENGK